MAEELAVMEESLRADDRWTFGAIVLVAFACLTVITPYRDIQLPPILMFAVGVSLLAFLFPLIMERHEILVLMLITYLPFSKVVPGTFGGFARTFNATNILLGLSTIGWVIAASMGRQRMYQREKPDIPMLLFLFLACISLIRGFILTEGRDPIEVIFAMKRWVTPMFIYFVIANNMRSIRQVCLVFYSFCFTTGAIGLLGIKKYYVDLGARSSMEKSRLGVTSGSNHLGFFMCSCVFLLVALWLFRRRKKVYWLLWIPILACVQTMRLTFSRGAQVGFVAGVLALLFMVNRRCFIAALLVCVFFAFYPSLIPPSIAGRLGTTVVGDSGPMTERLDRSSGDRLRIWAGGLRMISENPLMGVGYGNFRRRIGHYAPGQAGRDAHNTYLIVAAEMGVPAFLLFIYFFYLVFRKAVYVYCEAGREAEPNMHMIVVAYLAMFTAAMVSNIFGSRFDSVEVTVQIYAMTGVVVSASRFFLYHNELRDNDTDVDGAACRSS